MSWPRWWVKDLRVADLFIAAVGLHPLFGGRATFPNLQKRVKE